MAAESWREDAACIGLDTDLFIPDGDSHIEPLVWVTCRSCPAIQACLDYAITNRQRDGIWGGTRWSERSRMKPGDTPKILNRRCKDCGAPAPIPGTKYCGACADERQAANEVADRKRNQEAIAEEIWRAVRGVA